MSSGSDAFRAFSFCLPFFHLPRDASQFPLPLNRLPSVEHDDDDEEGGWPRFQRNTNLSNYYVEKDHPVCSRLLCARQRFPPLLSSLIAPPHLSRAANVPRHRSFRKDKSELILRPGSSFDKVERGAIGGATIKPLIALNREFFS